MSCSHVMSLNAGGNYNGGGPLCAAHAERSRSYMFYEKALAEELVFSEMRLNPVRRIE